MAAFGEARELGFRLYPRDLELWICGRADSNGFQVLGYRKISQRKYAFEQQLSYDILAGFDLYVDEESDLRELVRGRVIPPSPRSPSVVQKIKKWMSETTKKGESNSTPTMPSRILYIESNGRRVSLCVPGDMRKPYATLSHCWGSSCPMALTSETSPELLQGIETNKFPPSFQDAVWLAHELDLSYLWIDSLCIKQDDLEDWTRESALMHQVYVNASVSIAASRAADSSQGFLTDRDRNYITMPQSVGDRTGHIYVSGVAPRYAGDLHDLQHMADQPLSTRGWALQERCMSRRTIHFTRSQILLQKNDNLVAETTGFTGFVPGVGGYTLKTFKECKAPHSWHTIVTRYATRKLTVESDKLPALSGLASYAASYRNLASGNSSSADDYLAGLWRSSLLRDLCWTRDPHSLAGTRPLEYRAPSWSWAATDGTVNFHIFWPNPLATIIDAAVELKSPESPYGEILGAWLLLRSIKVQLVPPPPSDNHRGNDLYCCEDGIHFCVRVQWDAESHDLPSAADSMKSLQDSSQSEETHLIVMPLGWRDSERPEVVPGPFFLVLKPIAQRVPAHPETPAYQRVGTGQPYVESTIEEGGFGRTKQTLVNLTTSKWEKAEELGIAENIILV
ncbi:heterokaryon incompatibility protein-domain-containing protein [Xylariales sp. PMI_506]|nr:heterokaryon incompatibility protein-domain-containing protein [Xylariales sp. PMI_506]